jgi:hypothetical protein
MCACVRAFKLPHALHISKSFSGFSGTSNPHLNLGFGILLLHRLIWLAFPMLILRVVKMTEKHFWHMLFSWIFSSLLFFLQTIFYCIIHRRGRVYSCCSQILWIVHTMRDYRVTYKSVPLLCENSSATLV